LGENNKHENTLYHRERGEGVLFNLERRGGGEIRKFNITLSGVEAGERGMLDSPSKEWKKNHTEPYANGLAAPVAKETKEEKTQKRLYLGRQPGRVQRYPPGQKESPGKIPEKEELAN